ncbi:hypothetical protein MTsN2n6_27600 [Vibrio fortis]
MSSGDRLEDNKRGWDFIKKVMMCGAALKLLPQVSL